MVRSIACAPSLSGQQVQVKRYYHCKDGIGCRLANELCGCLSALPARSASRQYTLGRVLLTSSSSVPLLLIVLLIVPSSPCAWIRSRPDLDSIALTLFQHSLEPRAQASSADATSACGLEKPSIDLAPIARGPLQVGPRSGPPLGLEYFLLYIDYTFPLSLSRSPLLFSILVLDSLSPFPLPFSTVAALPSPRYYLDLSRARRRALFSKFSFCFTRRALSVLAARSVAGWTAFAFPSLSSPSFLLSFHSRILVSNAPDSSVNKRTRGRPSRRERSEAVSQASASRFPLLSRTHTSAPPPGRGPVFPLFPRTHG